jgi:biopolymer transport protein ExbD
MSRLLRSRRKKNSASIPEITLTPLIDTALTLLIIFMVTSPMINNSIRVDLPKGHAKEAQGIQEDLVVHIDKTNHFFLNGTACSNEQQLIAQLQKKIGTQKNQTVFIKGDTAIQYGQVLEFVDRLKMVGGIERVALATTAQAA